MIEIPLYDFKCTDKKCGLEFEWLAKFDEVVKCPLCWDTVAKKLPPQGKSPSFKLKYDPKVDRVDWDGNTSRYYDEYKKMKKEGKKPRIPQLDGDG